MGKLIYSMSISLDGFVETLSRSLDWVHVDDELHSVFNDEAQAMSAFLYGRRMYQMMVDYWPTAESDPSPTNRIDLRRSCRRILVAPGRTHPACVGCRGHVSDVMPVGASFRKAPDQSEGNSVAMPK